MCYQYGYAGICYVGEGAMKIIDFEHCGGCSFFSYSDRDCSEEVQCTYSADECQYETNFIEGDEEVAWQYLNPKWEYKSNLFSNRYIETCPVCNKNSFHYVHYTEEFAVLCEQHGYCTSCGYIVEQVYSSVETAFLDITKGYKMANGKYMSKNARKHRRIRRKLGIMNCNVNPEWVKCM